MSELEINSKDYWDMRFEKDWNDYGGTQQTEFFANLACYMLPEWFVREIRAKQYKICDMGCALGNGVDVMSKFLSVNVSGVDFSAAAIQKAKEMFPQYEFVKEDITNLSGNLHYDIVFCSNVLEHFYNPWSIFKNLTKISSHYIVLLVPFKETLEINEHVFNFDTNLIPIEIEEFKLVYLDTINGADIEKTYYPDQQILLIYSNNDEDKKLVYLKDITDGIVKSALKDSISKTNGYENEKNELLNQSDIYVQKIEYLESSLKNQLESYELIKNKLQDQIMLFNQNEDELKTQIHQKDNNISELQRQIDIYKENINVLKLEAGTIEKELEEIKYIVSESEDIIQKSLKQCNMMIRSHLFQLVHLLNRLINQGIKGKKVERKKFRKWFFSSLRGGGDADHRYHPLFSIIDILETRTKVHQLVPKSAKNENIYVDVDNSSALSVHLNKEEKRFDRALHKGKTKVALLTEDIIKNRKYKGILIYPHVVFWEPLQTPQQLLRSFAKQGWLCFFCEHPNIKDCFTEIEPNLIIIHEKDLLMAIGQTQVTVMLTWLGSLSFINKVVNKKIWYHILDKLDIFPYYDNYYMNLHNELVCKASFVSYVASPLLNCITNREDAIYLPNGTNPDELLNQHEGFIPSDMKSIVNKGHKIIGYYGYIAEWMNYNIIAKVALARPNYEFVFIGKAIHDTSLIDNIPNVHLLGLKPYKELSDYAKLFDVATIPFVINEMMDCVSPIKFYEYCALGLPVITSRMKEMELFVCEHVACFDNSDEYLFYLDKFVKTEIKELAEKNAPFIANDNTWLERAKKMSYQFDKEQQAILEKKYTDFDVIILSVIDFDFRYQRPQHLATSFSKNGHRVFYINANHFRETSIVNIDENLYIVNIKNLDYSAIHLTDWEHQKEELQASLDNLLYEYCIRDAITIVDYPNWIHGAEYLRSKYGFKMLTDYMDDYTGFLNPAEKLVGANCTILLEKSDMVIPSSQFLYDIAKKYNSNISIIRNGTEFKHFNKAIQKNENKERKVVGYYGAVAQWFDLEKVCFVAEHLLDCDIVIIGDVTEGRNKLQKHTNIKLLGEMPYEDLPRHLEYFDVCLIPFDTSTDLIKATNPVKFYEYLSAGKKIVATEIPELEPYKDKYVYMTNDNRKFLEYIQACLDSTDILASFEDCVEFGKANDWQIRYKNFAELCVKAVPKVSIIVLTYNNLDLNKICIDSILSRTAYPNYELIIVDNMSTDGTIEYLEKLDAKKLPNVKVILNKTNSGFAAGNNIGIKVSSGDYILLLNNDTIVTRGWLTSLVKHLENDEKLGMCGPVTNSIGNEAKIKVNYHTKNELSSFSYNYTWSHMGEQYENPSVLALFCTLIKREVINQCGLLDEEYGTGMFEDDDYAETVKRAGYCLTIAEDSYIHHSEGASFKKLENEKFRAIFEENKERFEKKWNKKWKVHNKRKGVNWDTNLDINI